MATIACDVYGTLVDPLGVTTALREHAGEAAPDFAARWRERQLEYTFRRALMRAYEDFAMCTRRALDHTCAATGIDLPAAAREALLASYRGLPAFDDAAAALPALRAAGHEVYAFSNGLPDDIEALLEGAGLRAHVDGVVSVHGVGSFKPDPEVYRHFERCSGADASSVWLASSNPFDVIGARAVGWRAAWVRRRPDAVFDPWDIEPTVTLATLGELPDALARA